jgi:hypothetical protein
MAVMVPLAFPDKMAAEAAAADIAIGLDWIGLDWIGSWVPWLLLHGTDIFKFNF